MTNTIANLTRKPGPDEMVVFTVTQSHARAEVVKRDDDLLTKDEVKTHWPKVAGAMLDELVTWSNLGCFS